MCKIDAIICNTRFFVFFVTFLSGVSTADARNNYKNSEANCNNVKSQTSYSLSDMAGYWYGIEILEHVIRSRPAVDSCIKIELQDRGNNHVNLIWREKNLDVTYKFIIDDSKHKGEWKSLGNQDVNDKPSGYDYEHFAGTVFILKASDSNIVLTFCSSTKLFTLVLSKTYAINSTELTSIHNLVTRFGVPQAKDIKRYCKNHANEAQAQPVLLSSIVVIALLHMYRKNM